jgi:hypothetical protein
MRSTPSVPARDRLRASLASAPAARASAISPRYNFATIKFSPLSSFYSDRVPLPPVPALAPPGAGTTRARARTLALWVLRRLHPLRPAAPGKFLASRGDKLNSARMQGVLAGQAQKWARKRETNAPTSRAKVRFRIENDVTRAII